MPLPEATTAPRGQEELHTSAPSNGRGYEIHLNGNGNGIAKIPQVAYLQLELSAWLKYLLERNGYELDQNQKSAVDFLATKFGDDFYHLLQEVLLPNAINLYRLEDLKAFYIPIIEQQLSEDPQAFSVILDQAIFYFVREALGEKFKGRILELSMTRPKQNLFTGAVGGKVSRAGYPPLPEQIAEIKRTVGEGNVRFVDDVVVNAGTMKTAIALCTEAGITVASPDKHVVYFVARRKEAGVLKPPAPHQHCVEMVGNPFSGEEREGIILGGAQDGERFVNPAFQPFSDATALRMADPKSGTEIINLPDVSLRLLALNRQLFIDMAGLLYKKPGDLKINAFGPVPADEEEEVTAEKNEKRKARPFLHSAINASLGRSATAPVTEDELATFCSETSMVDYLDAASRSVEQLSKKQLQVVCVGVDNTLVPLKTIIPDIDRFSGPILFSEKKLGQHVLARGLNALRQLLPPDKQATMNALVHEDFEHILPVLYRWGLAETAKQKYGEAAKKRIREIFVQAYGSGMGLVEAERFITSMPLEYHALRHLTWDLPLEDIYEFSDLPQKFALNICRRGGTLVFATTAPRIHTVKLLHALGIMQNPGPHNFKLYTVENFYKPSSIPRDDNRNPEELYSERDITAVLDELHMRNEISRDRIGLGGSSFGSHVQPSMSSGFPACIVREPAQLQTFAKSIALPLDHKCHDLFTEFEEPKNKRKSKK